MPIRDLHRNPFDEATLDKLSLYRDYLREWLPVFMNNRAVDTIFPKKLNCFSMKWTRLSTTD